MNDSHILVCVAVFFVGYHLGRSKALQQIAATQAAQAAQVPTDPADWFARVFDGSFAR